MSYETILLTLHILGAAVMFGAVFAAFVAVVKQPSTPIGLGRLKYLADFAKYASGWQLLTGILLYAREPAEFNAKPIFFVKLGLYVLAGVLSGTVLKRQGMKAGAAVQAGQSSVPANGLRTTVLILTLILVVIIAIGVTLVSGE